MEQNNKSVKTLQLLCVCVLGVYACLQIADDWSFISDVSRLNSDLVYWVVEVLYLIAYILIPLGVLLRKRILPIIGSVLRLIYVSLTYDEFSDFAPWARIVRLVVFAMLIVSCASKGKNAIMFAALTVVIDLLRSIALAFSYQSMGVDIPIAFVLNSTAIFWVGIVLLGFTYAGLYPIEKHHSTVPVSYTIPSENKIERLSKLNALRDKGIITQEEYEAKKKEIIG